MRKSGLQKQIASIFDDVPVPEADPTTGPLPVQQQTVDAETSKPLSQEEKEAAQTNAVHTPAVSTLRPKPLTKVQAKPQKEKTGQNITEQIKKMMYGSGKAQMNPRQKKMTILVGVLALVFGVVLFISLGGAGQSKAKPANDTTQADETQYQADRQNSMQWQKPQPLPAEMRNPMIPGAKLSTQGQNAAETGELVVRGIVFAKDNPSAIINGQIIRQGGSLYGVKIVNITKETVEFEKDGKRWTQQVQR